LTNQQLKNQILTEFYQTGRIDGYYFGIKSNAKTNSLKEFIKGCLYRSYLLENVGVQDNDFISDIYQTAFFQLAAMDADKFIEIYNKGKIKGSKLIGCTLRIIILKCFSQDRRNFNPKHALVSRLGFGSVFNPNNFQIKPMENREDEDDETPNLIIFDDEGVSDFESEYGFTPEEIIDKLPQETQFVFYKLLGKQKPGAKSNQDKADKQQLIDDLQAAKQALEKERGISND
jgi:hypothetical protein